MKSAGVCTSFIGALFFGLAGLVGAALSGCGSDSQPSTDAQASAHDSAVVDGGALAADAPVHADATMLADAGNSACSTGDKAVLADGTTVTKSGLHIASDNNSESGAAAINGGSLTLSDSTITKWNDGLCGTSSKADAAIASDTNVSGGGRPGGSGDGGMPGTPPGGNTPPGMPGTNGDGGMAMGPPPDGGMAPGGGDIPGGPGGGGSGTTGTSTAAVGASSSGVYAGSNSTAILSNLQISTSLDEGKGVCAVGNGASITMNKGTITTAGDSSHGAFATQSGSIKLTDVSITTTGEHCSTLATDQGGGTVIAEGGTFIAKGEYSAGIYSTGDIRASHASFTALADRVACMEGGSKITLTDCTLTAASKDAVIIYQSFSGDASVGVSEFTMTGGSITGMTADKPLIYVTNTACAINLTGVSLASASGIVLRALKGAWMDNPPNGATPTQGGAVTFIADGQTIPGDIELDENSSISATLNNKSAMAGAINTSGAGKTMSLTLDATSTWKVTAKSNLSALTLANASSLTAPTGKTLTMTVDGVVSPITAGVFKGAIVLDVQ